MAKIDLTSKEWCDLVFEGRNQELWSIRLAYDFFETT